MTCRPCARAIETSRFSRPSRSTGYSWGMRSATRLLVVTLLGLIVALLPVPALAAPTPSDREYVIVMAQPVAPTGPTTGAPDATAPTIQLDQAETEANRAETRRKLVMGILSVVLLGIVVWGRSVRRKRAKAAG